MKYLKLFENFLDEYTQDRKILIVIGSVNSGGVKSDSSIQVKMDAQTSWKMSLGKVIDLTGFIEILQTTFRVRDAQKQVKLNAILNDMDNTKLSKLIFGLVDMVKFGRDIEGFATEVVENLPKTKLTELLKKVRDIICWGKDKDSILNSKYISDFKFLEAFSRLGIDEKIAFYESIENDPNYLVKRGYIQLVVDESNLIEVCDNLLITMDEIKFNN
jgi:hypothetical protein